MTCAFTGPRPHKLPFPWNDEHPAFDSLLQRLTKEVAGLCEQGATDFYAGMARGCDLLFAEVVLALRDAYPIKLHAVIPYRGQSNAWDHIEKELYAEVLRQCGSAVYLYEAYQPGCCMERNRYLVDRADILLAVCDPDDIPLRSGTGATVRYAREQGKQIIFIPPFEPSTS